MKKTIAKHILGIIGVGILWFIINPILDSELGQERRGTYLHYYTHDFWDTDVFSDGGFLLLGMLIGYIVVYWAVRTIWFDKDKD